MWSDLYVLIDRQLQMLGYDFSWAAFHVVEVMSSSNVAQKRIGYLAAGQCFRQETEVLMLVTNLVKKVGSVWR